MTFIRSVYYTIHISVSSQLHIKLFVNSILIEPCMRMELRMELRVELRENGVGVELRENGVGVELRENGVES